MQTNNLLLALWKSGTLIILLSAMSHFGSAQGYLVVRAGVSDFNLRDVAQSYLSSDGEFVDVVTNAFSNTQGAAVDFFLPVNESQTFIVDFGAGYKNTSVFGNSLFKYTFKNDSSTLGTVKAAGQYGQFGFGIGYSPTGFDKALYVSAHLNFDFQYGSLVYPYDAFNTYQNNGYVLPNGLQVETQAFIGYRGKLNFGVRLSENAKLILCPGYIRTWKLEENFDTGEIKSSKPRSVFDFSFGFVQGLGL